MGNMYTEYTQHIMKNTKRKKSPNKNYGSNIPTLNSISNLHRAVGRKKIHETQMWRNKARKTPE